MPKLSDINLMTIKHFALKPKFAAQLFAIIAILFGLIFIAITPPLWGIDEPAHFGRAYQVAHGQIVPVKDSSKNIYGGYLPGNVKNLADIVIGELMRGPLRDNGIQSVENAQVYRRIQKEELNSQAVFYAFPGSATYSPVSYVPSSVGIVIASLLNLNIGNTINLARFMNLIVFVILIYFSLLILQESRIKWLIFVIALFPSSIFQASIVSADPLTTAATFLLIAIFIKTIFLKTKASRVETITLLSLALALPLLKPTNILIVTLLFFIPLSALTLRKWEINARVKSLSIIIGVALFLVWISVTMNVVGRLGTLGPLEELINPKEQLIYTLTHILELPRILFHTFIAHDSRYFFGFFGILGFNQINVPTLAIVFSIASVFLALLSLDKIDIKRRIIVALSLILLINFSAIFLILFMTFSPVGNYVIDGVQGRYFLPLAPLFLLMLSVFTQSFITFRNAVNLEGILLRTLPFFAIVSLSLSAVKYLYITWG